MFEISQSKFDNYIVNGEHILTLKIKKNMSIYWYEKTKTWVLKWFDKKQLKMCYKTKICNNISKITGYKFLYEYRNSIYEDDILEIKVQDFIKLNLSEQEILRGYKCGGVNWDKKEVELDPYILGMWLADKNSNGSQQYFLNKLTKYNLINNKHIPIEYLINDRETRLKVLAGIIDTDGYVYNNRKFIEISQTNNVLSDNIMYLARSLGFNCSNKKVDKITGSYNIITINGNNLNDIPIILEYKKLNTQNLIKNPLVTRIKVKSVGVGKYVGWTIGDNRRFLLGDFTVTHNTGKTAAAIGSIELIKNEKSNYTGAIILAKGKNLLSNFKKELVEESTKGIYIPENVEYLTQQERIRRTNKLVREYYSFEFYDGKSAKDNTFYQFAQYLSSKSDEFIIEKYSNKIIVLDEVHNIRIKDTEEGKEVYVYKEFHRFLHLIKNSKVLLLSGTPIKDTIDEFANIMNLILPLDEQFPIKDEFILEYFDNKGEFYNVKKEKIMDIKSKLKGRVSYLKAVTSTIKKVFEGEKKVGNLKHFVVCKDYMGSFQSDVYTEVYEHDKGGDQAFYTDSRQASLFVFPDKTFGDLGFGMEKNKAKKKEKDIDKNKPIIVNNNNIVEKAVKVRNKKGKMVDRFYYGISDNLKNILKPNKDTTHEEILQNIKIYSSKYESCIRKILESYKNKKSSFVYCEYIKGSSALLFSFILNLFGFNNSNGNETTKGMRYVLLNTISSKPHEIKFLVDRFNRPENLFGEYINVIIGSKVVSEGISFKNIQEEHILTPHWNYSETDQAIESLSIFFNTYTNVTS